MAASDSGNGMLRVATRSLAPLTLAPSRASLGSRARSRDTGIARGVGAAGEGEGPRIPAETDLGDDSSSDPNDNDFYRPRGGRVRL